MATDMFLKIPDVPGESLDRWHPNEIEVLSYSWGADATPSGPTPQLLMINKYLDRATPLLTRALCSGTIFPEVCLTARKPGERPLDFYRLFLTEVVVAASQQTGTSGAEPIQEVLSLSFRGFRMEYITQKPDGSAGDEVEVSWSAQ